MASEEAKLPEGERIDLVTIVTPNDQHFPVAKLFLESGFNVVCDKPMTFDLTEALALEQLVHETGKIFVLTHNYVGYPMVKEARDLVLDHTKSALAKSLGVRADEVASLHAAKNTSEKTMRLSKAHSLPLCS